MDEIEMEKRIEDRINMYHDSQTSFDELVGYIIILEAENRRLQENIKVIEKNADFWIDEARRLR